jgi:uncharacterized caspase-like protein
MSKSVSSWIATLCGTILIVLSTGAAWAERRVALVVGNSQYKNPDLVLSNPKNDAEDVAAVLRTLGFEIILTVDAGKRDLDLAMTQFARLAGDADAALFYYAGHALQYQGRNYLMPIDAELEDEISVRYQLMWLDDVGAALKRAGGVKIMILDACRNNPVVDSLKRKISRPMVGVTRNVETGRGLAQIDKAQGIIVAYATAADEVAADGTGRNSPFTGALLKRLQEPGLEIAKMFRRIAADVNEQTNGQQRPEIHISLIDEYYLNQKDRLVWDQIKDSTDPAAFRDFVARFPSSPQASDAQYRLQTLERVARERQLERERAENAAAQARFAAVERERADREAVQRQAEEQRARLAAIEREKLERDTAQRRRDEDQRAKAEVELAKAEAERQKQAGVAPDPLPMPLTTNLQSLPMTQEQACKRDEETLARLRASQARDGVIRLERELGCEGLRPQLLRLRESIFAEGERSTRDHAAQQAQAERQNPKNDAERQAPEREASAKGPPTSIPQDQICKRDAETLARLRASQQRDEIIRFERELGCEKLRPQVVRLRESVGSN